MKAKVLKDFKDKYTGERHTAGETIDVSKERFDEILTVDKLVEEVTVEEVPAKEPKKTARKATKKSAE